MRIGTWNVEYGVGAEKNARRLRRLREMNCDVWILTETHDDLDLGADYQAVSTTPRPNKRAGSRWTTIWSRLPIVKSVAVEDLNRTVAVLLESPVGPLIVFGTVLPWNTDRGANGLGKGGRSSIGSRRCSRKSGRSSQRRIQASRFASRATST